MQEIQSKSGNFKVNYGPRISKIPGQTKLNLISNMRKDLFHLT